MTGAVLSRGPRRVLVSYLSRSLFTRTAMCCGIIIALMEILALMEQMTPILKRHLGVKGVLTYMVLHLPAMMQTALPLSVLIGGLVLFTQMTISSEIAILRAAGLSPWGFVRKLLPVTLLIGLFGVVLEDQVTPRSELALAAWWNRTALAPADGKSFWFHLPASEASVCKTAGTEAPPTAEELAHVGYVADGGNEVFDVALYDLSNDGRILRTLHADHAWHSAHGWLLSHIHCVTVSFAELDTTAREKDVSDAQWSNPFAPTEMLRLSLDSAPLTSGMILKTLEGKTVSNQPPGYLRASLFERFLRPLSFIVMLLLAMPVIYIPPRTGLKSWLPVWCLGAGLLFIVVQGMFRAMGNAGILPAPVATVPGLIIFALAAGTALLRNEDK